MPFADFLQPRKCRSRTTSDALSPRLATPHTPPKHTLLSRNLGPLTSPHPRGIISINHATPGATTIVTTGILNPPITRTTIGMFYLVDIHTYHRNYGTTSSSLQASEEENEHSKFLWHPFGGQASSSMNDDNDDDDENNSGKGQRDSYPNRYNHRRTRRNRRRYYDPRHHYHDHEEGEEEEEERLLNIDEAVQSLGMGIFQYRIAVAAGMLLAADSMEVVLLAFLSNVFRKLQQQQQQQQSQDPLVFMLPETDMNHTYSVDDDMSDSFMNRIVVPAGVVGALVWGMMGDWKGRRPVLVGTALLVSLASIATALCTTYPALVVTRLVVAFGIGGLTVPFCTFSEFLPPSQRGTHLIAVQVFCILGALLIHLVLAQQQLPHVEERWRSIVVWCSMPCLLATLLGWTVVPESPRWLLSQNRADEALAILRVAAKANGKDPTLLFPPGTMLYSHEPQLHPPVQYNHDDNDEPPVPRWSSWSRISTGWLRLSAIVGGTYFGMSFLTHGTMSLAVSVFSNDHRQQDYQGIFTAASQFLSLFLLVFLIDAVGRSSTQCLVYALGGILCLTISLLEDYHTNGHPNVLLVLTFLAHTCMFGGKCATWISTTELLTTEVRTTGHGMANSVSRIGGFLSTYVLSHISSLPSVGLALFLISLWTASTASKLPETNAKEMGIVWIPPTTVATVRRRLRDATHPTPFTTTTTSKDRKNMHDAPPTEIYV
jgi:MFS family permease